MDLFPLGHVGVALNSLEVNRKELREEVRMPTMEDMITAISYVGTPR